MEQFVETELGKNQFKSLFIYLSSVAKKIDMKEMIESRSIGTTLQEEGLTAYEKAVQEGVIKARNLHKKEIEKYLKQQQLLQQQLLQKEQQQLLQQQQLLKLKKQKEQQALKLKKQQEQQILKLEKLKREKEQQALKLKKQQEQQILKLEKEKKEKEQQVLKLKQEKAQEQQRITVYILNMLQYSSMPIEQIAKSVGASIEYVKQLKATLNNKK